MENLSRLSSYVGLWRWGFEVLAEDYLLICLVDKDELRGHFNNLGRDELSLSYKVMELGGKMCTYRQTIRLRNTRSYNVFLFHGSPH